MNAKNLLRRIAERTLLVPLRSIRHGRKVVLCFHSIKPSASHSHIPPADFRRILRWLTTHCDVMGVEELLRSERANMERPAVALTFDDGHKDYFTHAMPIALDFGVRFSFYVTVGLIERDPAAEARFACLLRQVKPDFEALNWDEVGALREAGFPVGSHTWDHPMLSHLSDDGIEFQLGYSREILARRIGSFDFGICYPYGKYGRNVDARVVGQARKCGYKYGLAVCHRRVTERDDIFALPRFIVNSGDLDRLARMVYGHEDGHGFVTDHMPAALGKFLSPSDYAEPMAAPAPIEGI